MCKVTGISHLAIAIVIEVAAALGFVARVHLVHVIEHLLLLAWLLLLRHLLLLWVNSLLCHLLLLNLWLRHWLRLLDLLLCHRWLLNRLLGWL